MHKELIEQIQVILSRGSNIEIRQSKDGIKIYEVKKKVIKTINKTPV